MLYNVAQLLQEPIGATRHHELAEELAALEELDADLEFLAPLTGSVTLLRTNSGVLVTGTLQTRVLATCNRCLEPVGRDVEFRLEESFRPLTEVQTGRFIPPQQFEGSEEELTDAALLIDDHHILDISEIVRQNLWLSLPMIPGCIWDDPQQCPHYLERLEEIRDVHSDLEEAAGEEMAEIDPRWASLLALRDRLGGDE